MENKKITVWLIVPKTNLHVGNENTSSYGIIDKAIQRDVLTDLPCIYSSSLKGALNEFCCSVLREGEDAKKRITIFGCDQKRKGEVETSKGRAIFFDAKLLFLPKQDDRDLFVYTTSEKVLEQFQSRVRMFVPDFKIDMQQLQQYFQLPRRVEIESNEMFHERCDNLNLPIIARNCLENGVSQNLWYEQILPMETILYTVTIDDDDTLENVLEGQLVQIGANATIGYGFCYFKKLL